MSWYDVWSSHFRGKNLKNPPLGYIFSGVDKKLLQSHIRPTHCTKPLQKTLTSKRYIAFVLIATTHYPGLRCFSWFLFFLRNGEDKSRLVFTASWLSHSSLMGRKIKENLGDQVNHTSAEGRYSSSIMLKFQQNRTKPQVIRFVFNFLVQL